MKAVFSFSIIFLLSLIVPSYSQPISDPFEGLGIQDLISLAIQDALDISLREVEDKYWYYLEGSRVRKTEQKILL